MENKSLERDVSRYKADEGREGDGLNPNIEAEIFNRAREIVVENAAKALDDRPILLVAIKQAADQVLAGYDLSEQENSQAYIDCVLEQMSSERTRGRQSQRLRDAKAHEDFLKRTLNDH